jgi:Na+-transporting NADH:ubiquinone oxidoreductase subunit C
MPVDSTKKTIGVALGVCLVCSILVSAAAVSLQSIQNRNKALDKLENILIAGGLYEEGVDVVETYEEKIKAVMVDLESGEVLPEDRYSGVLNPRAFDIKAMVRDPEHSQKIAADRDLANILRKPNVMPVYEVTTAGRIDRYIFPIYGKGLWSTLYGFLTLDRDLHTLRGITYYDHGETPGLGGEVDNPRWKEQWDGKRAFDEDGRVRITVIKGIVDRSSPEAVYEVDGLSGSTLTTRGVDNMVKFWLGADGYGPFIEKLREEGVHG